MKSFKLKKISKKTIKDIARDLKEGKIAVFPTDTVYGLGTNAFCLESVKKISGIKNRAGRKQFPVLVDSIKRIKKIVRKIPTGAVRLTRKFWPGPLTLIFETNELGMILTGGKKSIAVRIPDNEILCSIIREMDCPLIGTSANVAGKKACGSIGEIDKRILKSVDIAMDGGTVKLGKPSTVVNVGKFPYVIVREGSISKKDLEKFMKI